MARNQSRRTLRSLARHPVPVQGPRVNYAKVFGITLFVLLLVWFGFTSYRSFATQRFFDTVVTSLDSRGEVVFDKRNGTPKRLFVCLKQLHGGVSTARVLMQDDTSFDLFFQHHDALRTILEQQLKQANVGKIHFFFEGFAGEKDAWSPADRAMLLSAVEIDEALSKPGQQPIVLASLRSMPFRDSQDMYQTLLVLNANGRFASFCHARGYPVVHGADPPKHPVLANTVHALLQSLASKEEVADADIELVIARIQQSWIEDEGVRHRYILQQMQRVPNGGVGVILLGSGHFEAGANYTHGAAVQSLESQLTSLPDTRTVVFDEKHLPDLLAETSKRVMMVGRNMTPEHVRMYLNQAKK